MYVWALLKDMTLYELYVVIHVHVHVLMRDEKEGRRKKEASNM